MTPAVAFETWRAQFDTALRDIYGIDIEDAGLDDEYLRDLYTGWADDHEGAARWYGNKYDLDPR